jgi:hypothetical protein
MACDSGSIGERQNLVHVIKADELLPFLIIGDPATGRIPADFGHDSGSN